MVETARIPSEGEESRPLDDLRNGIDEDKLKGFVADIEAQQSEIDRIMENARMASQPHTDNIKAIIKEAAECGIEKKAFRGALRHRALNRKAEAVRATLSVRQQEVYDEIQLKLGDLLDEADASNDRAGL